MNSSPLLRALACFFLPMTVIFAQTPTPQPSAPAQPGAPLKAIAVLYPTEGSKVKGTLTFTEAADGVHVQGEITGLTPGKHGFHIHEFGDCSSPDAASAGAHFNPTDKPHGAPDSHDRHAGDLGNIEADASGVAKVDFVDHDMSLTKGKESAIGRSVIVHTKADDLKTQPTGDSGARLACGVIGRAKN